MNARRTPLVTLLLALTVTSALAQGPTEQRLRSEFTRRVAPKLDGTSGLTLEALTTLVTGWVEEVRRERVTTLEPQVEQAVTGVERLIRRQADDLRARCTPGPGADVAWTYLERNAFILRPGLVGDFTPLRGALERCLSFEVVLRSEVRLRHADMDVVITTEVEGVVPLTVDLRTREASGQAPLTLTRTDYAFTNGCVAQVTPTSGLLRVERLGVLPFNRAGPFASPYTEYAFQYKVTGPQQFTRASCGPATAVIPGAGDFTWALPFRLAHQPELMPSGAYLPPVGSHEAPSGAVLNRWTWRQDVPGMPGASEYTSLKVIHSPR
ncbi:hypothetical protein [Deinococcus pimensis]|uniref:hypothetical protein n=1 Tax=Deinococcus pimensis TaxID=309888 RepID=UPI000484427B|nr:hypothetical protein [Deinococcus pimensis]